MENNAPDMNHAIPVAPPTSDIPVSSSLPDTPSTPPPVKKPMKLMYIIFSIIVVLMIIIFTSIYFLAKRKTPPTTTKNTTITPTKAMKKSTNPDVIFKVGEEEIFKSDMDAELAATSEKDTLELRARISDKIAQDSAILQAGRKDGIIELDESVFNSPDKDYTKRIKLVTEVEDKITANENAVKGAVIAIWFHNNDWIGPQGLEASKKIAFDKISELQKKVNNKEMTMEEAGKAISDDTSLAEVDKAYKSNAYYTFDVEAGKPITISKEFDTLLRNQALDAVSAVYLAKNVDIDPAKQYEALYYVGMVTEKTKSSGPDFNTWLETAKSTYAVSK